MLEFEWNEKKALENRRKHGVSFVQAAQAFADPLSLTIPDPEHSGTEERFVLLGQTARSHLVVVVHTERENSIRIISARRANAKEQRDYEHGI